MLKKVLIFTLLAMVMITTFPFQRAEAYTWRYSDSNYSTRYSTSSPTFQKSYTGTTSSEIKYGSTGTKVLEVQKYLKNLGYDLRTENGRYGYYTLKAVLDFQKKNNLSATGRVDTKTLAELKKVITTKVNTPVSQPIPSKPSPTPTEPTPVQTVKPSTPSNSQVQGLTADEKQMFDLVNSERNKNGLVLLKIDMDLVRLARLKSKDMIDKNYFSHTSPTYGSPFTMMKNAGIVYRTAGENLAGAGSVSRAHTNLMNSSGHRANILNSAYTHIGIGIVDGGSYGKMFTQMFVGR
ncbi:MAG: peptidoglycan-binding protein [Halanaerobiales bacterium]|nr:peptidoglycan-binding protein [Halanaerobiales bacterium]